MNAFNLLQEKMEKVIMPLAEKLSKNKVLRALQAGMMLTMPVTLGAAVVAILGNLPIDIWQNFLKDAGIYAVAQEFLASTLSMLAIYMVVANAYTYAKNENENGAIVAILALASFITLMPQYVTAGETSIGALLSGYLGANGIFVAMFVGIIIAKLYCWLGTKNLKLKLPDTIPPMVTDSLEPVFIAMILFSGIFVVKYGFTLTSYGNIFTFIADVVTKPVMLFGSSPWALIGVYTFGAVMFFFGIHPATIITVYAPVITTAMTANAQAAIAGQPLPYLTFAIVFLCISIGGTGSTLGFSFATLFAKSDRFKSLSKLLFIPNIFNINEPVIYGVPLMLNPIFFIPMLLSAVVPGAAAYGPITLFESSIKFDVLSSLPWVTPVVVTSFLKGGLLVTGIVLVCIILDYLLYLPFFKIADKRALLEEQTIKAEGETNEDNK